MAEEATDEAQQDEASGGGKKNIILFAVVLLVAIGASVGGTIFFLSPGEEAPVAETAAPVSNKPGAPPPRTGRP